MARGLEARDADRIGPELLGLLRKAHRGALVQHLDAGRLEGGDEFRRIAARRFGERHALVDDDLRVGIGFHIEIRQDREVDAEGLVGQRACPGDLLGERGGRGLRVRGQEAEAARVRHRGDQFRARHVPHAPLHQRVLDAEKLGDACPEHALLTSGRYGLNRARVRRRVADRILARVRIFVQAPTVLATEEGRLVARLDGKVAVVTGGTQGIGRGIVLRFLKEGARVVYCSRNPKNNEEMLPLHRCDPRRRERARIVAADVGVKEQIQGVVHEAARHFGRLDIVVNNAQGIAPLKPILDKPDEDYAMTLATGFYHSLWTMQAAVPYIRAHGEGGAFINFSSHWALNGMNYSSDYNITKSANEALTRSAANEFGRYGITVNCIVPSGDSFAYRAYVAANPGMDKAIDAVIPMRRMGDCEIDIAGGVLGLVSRNGRFITGQVFYVDGGCWLARPPNEHAVDTDIHTGRHQSAKGVGA